jgi:hypothetical protein
MLLLAINGTTICNVMLVLEVYGAVYPSLAYF